MTKDIKDYLHLYLGCEVEWGFDGRKKKGVLIGKDERYGWQIFDPLNVIVPYQYCRTDLLKPILRPLSDMTEEEARVILPDMQTEDKLIEWGYYNEYSDGNVFYQYLKKAEDERLSSIIEDSLGVPEHWIFLLSKGFDLFGLIESGLAIDKTKLQS